MIRYRIFKYFIVNLVMFISIMSLSCGVDDDDDDNEYQPDSRINTYYVSKAGDDNSDGQTIDTPFRTIGRAFKVVGPGDTVLILPGIYHEELTLEGVGNPDAPIIIRGEDRTAVLDGQKKLNIGIWLEQCINILIENLEIRNYTDIGIGVFLSSDLTLRHLTVHQNGTNAQLEDWEIEGYGIHADESKKITIENNEVYQNGPQPQSMKNLMGTGINTFGLTDSVIRNNRCYENIGGGILVEDGVNILVEGNEVFSNDLDASVDEWWDGGIWLDGGHDVTVRNNLFLNNKGPGIEISDEDHQKPHGYVIENNTSTGNYYGIYIWNFGTSAFPSEQILQMSKNQISKNSRQNIWIVPWNCPPPTPCD